MVEFTSVSSRSLDCLPLPSFPTPDPEEWFTVLEQHFQIHKFTDDIDKFFYLIYHLPTEVLYEWHRTICYFIGDYATLRGLVLKSAELKRAAHLDSQQSDDSVHAVPPKDVCDLHDLAKESLILSQDYIGVSPECPLTSLTPLSSYSAVDLPDQPAAVVDISTLQSVISALRKDVDSLLTIRKPFKRQNQPVSSGNQPSAGLCWYHCKFGSRARRCRPHCRRAQTSVATTPNQQTLTNSSDIASNDLFFITDRNSNTRFLVDTGAEISVIPGVTTDPEAAPLDPHAADDSPIATYGQRAMTLDFGLQHKFSWVFTMAAVPFAIIGLDFLQNFDLIIDTKRRVLVDGTPRLGVLGSPPEVSPSHLALTKKASGIANKKPRRHRAPIPPAVTVHATRSTAPNACPGQQRVAPIMPVDNQTKPPPNKNRFGFHRRCSKQAAASMLQHQPTSTVEVNNTHRRSPLTLHTLFRQAVSPAIHGPTQHGKWASVAHQPSFAKRCPYTPDERLRFVSVMSTLTTTSTSSLHVPSANTRTSADAPRVSVHPTTQSAIAGVQEPTGFKRDPGNHSSETKLLTNHHSPT